MKGELTIEDKTWKNVRLIVKSPELTVNNKGTFKSIEIKDISPETWYERSGGKGNNAFTITASKSHVVLEKGISTKNVKFSGSNVTEAVLDVENGANGGKITFDEPVKNVSVAVAPDATLGDVSFTEKAKESAVDLYVSGEVAINIDSTLVRKITSGGSANITSVELSGIESFKVDGIERQTDVGDGKNKYIQIMVEKDSYQIVVVYALKVTENGKIETQYMTQTITVKKDSTSGRWGQNVGELSFSKNKPAI